MAPRDLIVVGGGEHARVVVDAARTRPDLWHVRGFVDPRPVAQTVALGLEWLGDDSRALATQLPHHAFVLGVGAIGPGSVRAAIVTRYDEAGVSWATVVHASAVVSPTALLGEGTAVLAGAIVNPGAVVGRHVVVNSAAVVEHDVRVGDLAQIAPAAAVGGGASLGRDCYLGLGCRVRNHVEVGEGALVGMGAVVVAPVRPGAVVMGVPAKEWKR